MVSSITVPDRVTAEPPLIIPDLRLPDFVLREARARGAKTALIEADTGRRISYAALADAVDAAAGWLVQAGVRAGDVLALCAPNSIDFAVTWHAASSAGAVLAASNHVWADEEIVAHLRRTGARWLVTTRPEYDTRLAAVARQVSGLAGIFVFGTDADAPVRSALPADAAPSARRFDVLGLEPPSASAATMAATDLSPDDVAFLPTSSGTTGHPKTVVLSHRNLVANLCQVTSVQTAAASDVALVVAPMFAIMGLQVSLNAGLVRGATVVVLRQFELGAFLRAVQDFRVTRTEVTPAVAVLLAKSELVADFDLSSLRLLSVGAAPLGIDVARACRQRLGVRVYQGYGLTEGGALHLGLDAGPDCPDTVGPPLPGVECRIVDPVTGAELGIGQPGELLVRTPAMMRGYLDNAEATAATIDPDGWLHTGDIVTAREDGWYRVTDRIKELIKTNGLQVAPAQLEDVLLAHPAVADVAVVRSPDAEAGEVPKAYVVRSPGHEVDGAELMGWVADRVAAYKRVRRVEFVDVIPKSPTGKILRRELAEREAGLNG